MARIIYPINDKMYTAEDVEIFNSPRTSGVYSVLDFDYSLSGNVLSVGKGLAWIKNDDFKGKSVAFTEPETLALDSADDTLDRYDVVAIRYDATKTEPEIVVVKGEPSKAPVMPTRNTEVYLYELFLYSILRKAGESVVDSNNVSDLRENEAYCGIMRDSVTSAVAPVYETIYDGEGLSPGDAVNFDVDKYEYLIATVTATVVPKISGDVVLRRGVDSFAFGAGQTAEPRKMFSGSGIFSMDANTDDMALYLYVDLTRSLSGITVRKCTAAGEPDATQTQHVKITKLVGVTKQPEGYVKVDSVYNPESHNAQSGEAVKQAIEEALENFEGGGDIEVPENVEEDIDEIKVSIGETTYIKNITSDLDITNGFYHRDTGTLSANANAQASNIFAVEQGEKYYITGCYGYFASLIVAFDENSTYLPDKSIFTTESKSIQADDYEYIVPEGVAYIGCSTRQTIAASSTTGRDLIVKKEVTELNSVPSLIEEVEKKLNEDILNLQNKIDDDITDLDEKLTLTVENICLNSNFDDNSVWESGNTATSVDVANNIAVLTNDGSSTQTRIRQAFPRVEENHIYYIQASIKSSPNTLYEQFTFYTDKANVFVLENPKLKNSVGSFNDYFGTFEFTETPPTNTKLWITSIFQTNATAKDQTTQIKKVFVCDLTKSFGAGKEPTASEFYNILKSGGKWFEGAKQIFTIDLIKPTLPISADYLITVGENGDYQTINEAIAEASSVYPIYKKRGIKIEIRILDGTVIDEQILVEGLDLSYISITTDNTDNKVIVTPTANNWSKSTVSHDTRGNMPFFAGEFGARLPMIKCLFSCTSPTLDINGETIGIVGYYCNRGSMGVIVAGAAYSENTTGSDAGEKEADVGFEGFYDCIIANNNSEIVLREAIARNAGRYGVMSRHISRVSARSADITNCADTAAYADRSSMIDVRFADVSGSNNGLQAFNTSNMTAVETIANNITNIVADSREGSVLNCAEMTIDNVKDVFKVLNGGTIIATSTAPTNVSGTLNSKEKNTVDINGVIYG